MLSFRLAESFIEPYKTRPVDWGFIDSGGNALGEIVYLRTYSRKKEDGTKERWWETCQRVINGMTSLQKEYCKTNRLPWSNVKAQNTAQDAYERLFSFKWTPPGRGLWIMGTPLVNDQRNSAALQNCSFISTADMTKDDPTYPFTFLMEASMLGVGVGFDSLGAKKNFKIQKPELSSDFVIPDSREGWVESLKILLESYLKQDMSLPTFDYSLIRPAGAPIKIFGGTAAGPQFLVDLHESIKGIFKDRSGTLLTTTDIADIGNLIGVCVVSGNVRRSAELLMGSIDDDEFLNLKNYDGLGAKRPWGWMSNNSVSVNVGDDLSKIVPGIAANGEPGVVWMDLSRQYGRLADPRNDKDHRVAGYNPCLISSANLLTKNGWTTFGDAYKSGDKQTIIQDARVTYQATIDGEEHSSNWKFDLTTGVRGIEQEASQVFLTQKDARVVKLSTKQGYEVTLTPDHLVATKSRGMIAAEDLCAGEEILLTAGALPSVGITGRDPQTVEEIEAALMGLIAGDGTFGKGKSTENVKLGFWGEDRSSVARVSSWIDVLWDRYGDEIVSPGDRPYTRYWVSEVPERNETRLQSSFLAALLKEKYGFQKSTKLVVPKAIMENARTTQGLFYVAGLSFADGYVNKYNKVGSSSARISQSDKPILQSIQKILLANGIASTIYLRRPERQSLLPTYELLIMNHKYEFASLIGFLGSHKDQTALENLTPSRKRNGFSATVSSVEDAGIEDVYCLREPIRRTLCADGITMRRCAEQSLESGECCTLVETFIDRHEDLEDYKKTLKVAYLYAKTVTLLPTHWPRTNAIMQRNRRIGTSLAGVTNFVDSRGLPLLRQWMDLGYNEINRLDKTYSEWLGVRESIKKTTVKPGGTTPQLPGSTPGIHWGAGGSTFMRSIRMSKEDPMVFLLDKAGYTIEIDVANPKSTVVVYFPIKSNAKRSENEVSVFEKAALAALAQRYWSDNSVSVTLSFDPETESQHVGTILSMYEGQLKTVSFLPMIKGGAYKQMPYGKLTEEEWKKWTFKLFQIDWSPIYDGLGIEAIGEQFCETDVCVAKDFLKDAIKEG